MKNKGFIGPIGDDLPSLIAIMLALTLFFTGLTFAMRTFNTKQRDVRLMQGGLDVSRAIVGDSIIEYDSKKLVDVPEAKSIARNNDLAFNADYGGDEIEGSPFNSDDPNKGCGEESLYFSYLVSRKEGDNIELETLRVCVWDVR
ncbi:MAG: hypothetical protein ACOCTT_00050 [archaeon]